VMRNVEDWGLYISSTSGSNIVFSNNVCYSMSTVAAAYSGVNIVATTGVHTISGNYFFVSSSTAASFINISDAVPVLRLHPSKYKLK